MPPFSQLCLFWGAVALAFMPALVRTCLTFQPTAGGGRLPGQNLLQSLLLAAGLFLIRVLGLRGRSWLSIVALATGIGRRRRRVGRCARVGGTSIAPVAGCPVSGIARRGGVWILCR